MGKQERFEDWTKRRVEMGEREIEEISADEVMRAAKPGCSSSQIKTQTHQTHCNVNIIPPPKYLDIPSLGHA